MASKIIYSPFLELSSNRSLNSKLIPPYYQELESKPKVPFNIPLVGNVYNVTSEVAIPNTGHQHESGPQMD